MARSFGANAVDYELHKFKGILCSSCELFTDIDHSYVPMANVVTSGGFEAVVDFCKGMGEECYQSLSDMLAFEFSRGPRLDVKQPRLRKIERQVRMRAKHLIEV